MNIVFCFADSANEWNTSSWRAHVPSNGLNAHLSHGGRCIPLSDFVQYGHPSIQAIIGEADAIVVQRNLLNKEIWDACDYWRGLGKLVVADLDDDYPHLTPQNPAYSFWILDKGGLEAQTGYKPIDALTEGFRHVDALISPNRLILKDWSKIVPGYWIPNYAYGEWYKDIKQKPTSQLDEDIIIGWGGSVSHWDGWWFSGLGEAVPILTEKYPRIKWKICGNDHRVLKWFGELVPENRWLHQPGVPPGQWPQQVASFDIGLAPLCGPDAPQGESYDQHRSWLKALEYALCGVPWVGSDGGVYDELESDTSGFCVVNSVKGWVDGISKIVDGLDGFKRKAKRQLPWSRANLIMENVVDRYVLVFQRMLSERNASLNMRLPGVLYTKDLFEQVAEIKQVEIVNTPGLELDDLLEYQRATFALSGNWHSDVESEYHGVDIADCMRYPFLHYVNQQLFAEVMHV